MRLYLKAIDVRFVVCGNAVPKWLDHIIGKEHSNIKVTNVKILTDISGSDHVPI